MSRVEVASKQISDVFYDWLKAEVNSSGIERNKYLDEYDTAVEGLKAGWDDPRNFTARKLESHLDRLPRWFEAFSLDPTDDYQAARLVFAGLIQVSGSYRNQCYVEAKNGDDYMDRRGRVIGIDINQPVSVRLHTHLPNTGNFANARLSIKSVDKRRIEAQKIGSENVHALAAYVSSGHDLGREGSRSVNEMINAQYNWLTFATDCLTLVAKKRGGELATVPFLEPRSITDQSGELHYPLASPVDWQEVVAT